MEKKQKIATWHTETIGKLAAEALQENGFNASYFSTVAEATEAIMGEIQPGMRVGFGGSMTINALQIQEKAREKEAVLLDHGAEGLSPEEKLEIMRQQLTADIFLCSSNAVTLDGYLVNIDGAGNRVAAMSFGPRKNIVVIGTNKICKTLEAAYERIERIAAPQNNKRLQMENPCVARGICLDCKNETRICRIYSVMKRKPIRSNFDVIIIGEKLGY